MVISHKYKFIFIKTFKTAGTSIEVFLSKYCSKNDILTPIYPEVESHLPRNYDGFFNPIFEIMYERKNLKKIVTELIKKRKFYNHISANSVRARIPKKIWKTYFKFCVERNPWDKVLSHYYMVNYRSGGKISLENYFKLIKNQKANSNLTYNRFYYSDNNGNTIKDYFCFNYPLYTNSSGLIILDRILSYENLNLGLIEIFNNLGVPFGGSLKERAKSHYRINKKHYNEIFTCQQKDLIQEIFSDEIRLHGQKYRN
jgi:hypothetical protein